MRENYEDVVVPVVNLGMDVYVRFVDGSIYKKVVATGRWDTVVHNVTEYHWAYPSPCNAIFERLNVAFESAIHSTGMTIGIKEIEEFMVVAATVLGESF